MKFSAFSPKQMQVLTWWCDTADTAGLDAIICDGAVRSGKTLCMGISFFSWAMKNFDGQRFGLCGKTITALRRNLVSVILPVLRQLGFRCEEKVSRNALEVSFGGRQNTFYLFGGRDEGSAALIQGVTFAGVMLDEAALMPRSFVEQACARCSVPGSRLWFNCNPEGPEHWFYKEWICRAAERRALYLHFTMEDNPSLSRKILERYRKLYSGTFYRRFVLGEWTAVSGRIYDFFDESYVSDPPEGEMEEWAVSCDYGTVNPASFGLWGLRDGVWYRVKEYYYSSRNVGRQKTDAEYAADLLALAEGKRLSFIVVDPSAASFIEALRREGLPVRKAENDVLRGIRLTADLLKQRKLVICRDCTDALREFSMYVWDERAGRDAPVKRNDHAMDDIRYFACAVSENQTEVITAIFAER